MKIIPRRCISHYPGQLRDILPLLFGRKTGQAGSVEKFEQRFAEYIGVKFAVAVSSGRLGLSLILQAMGLVKGDEVILPAYTDESVPEAIRGLGLVPVFVDINPADNNIDVTQIEPRITARTRVILATHIFGRPCDLGGILAIAKRHNLEVVEDCAHALGAEYRAKRTGGFGRAAYFSFGITKPFNTFGGGMVTTNDPELCAGIRRALENAQFPRHSLLIKNILASYFLSWVTNPFLFPALGFPLLNILTLAGRDPAALYCRTIKPIVRAGKARIKYTDLQAVAGLGQLKVLEENNRRRRQNALLLKSMLDGKFRMLQDAALTLPTYYFFVINAGDPGRVCRRLLHRGIDSGRFLMRNCAALEGTQDCPHAREAFQKSIQVPNHPGLRESDMSYIAGALNKAGNE